ncbi:hypothetical protein SDRG_16466 [Saprolegnia diclina VS20]|uniref:FAD-binding FR-type domain-containing protein n=1 Tax=Saprolegnia diclina (strain VS20) TaxID=1156394 RepID=T0PTW6_SAPDV|nr:hypothetical protein SDRG_16466 [Saprolegnia diclina VS20]EQC25681.1 hypothetical protein SDRG_16466 [Saprolegnia diclina VS20]|eukprot:XP_008620900.1 hypothetical protein SDRG_16466 [Saprolegnia diclina VS20]
MVAWLRATLLLAATPVVVATMSDCTPEALTNVKSVAMGPMVLKAKLLANVACFQVILTERAAPWIAVAVAASPVMVNAPTSSAVVFDTTTLLPLLYVLKGYEVADVVLQKDQSSISVIAASATPQRISFIFARPMSAQTPTDVAIVPGVPSTLLWAVGDHAWPSHHIERGIVHVTIPSSDSSGSGSSSAVSTFVTSYTVLIVLSAFLCIVLLGFAATGWPCAFVGQPLCRPPKPTRTAPLRRVLADVSIGNAIVVSVYVMSLLVVGVVVVHQFGADATGARRLSLVSGHLALVSLMWLLLPIARGYHWELIFGISHERVLKFHRWLGLLVTLTAALHLAVNANRGIDVLSRAVYGTQEVVPLYGFVAFVAFSSIALLGMLEPLRRTMYEVFYLHHRTFSIIGLVCVLLHSSTVAYSLALPLALYVWTLLLRSRAYWTSADATVCDASESRRTVVLMLPFTPTTKQFAATMPPGAYFFLQVPSVSGVEWHPFSAIVTPDGNSIGFCLKASSPHSFVHKVLCSNTRVLGLRLGGPYGRIALNWNALDVVVLIAGGIGITPLLNIINQRRQKAKARTSLRAPQLVLHWIVPTPDDLLCADRLMFPMLPDVQCHCYATRATADGVVTSAYGGDVAYVAKRPVLQDVLVLDPFESPRVGVVACGPQSLVDEAQYEAALRGFCFHKELFALA